MAVAGRLSYSLRISRLRLLGLCALRSQYYRVRATMITPCFWDVLISTREIVHLAILRNTFLSAPVTKLKLLSPWSPLNFILNERRSWGLVTSAEVHLPKYFRFFPERVQVRDSDFPNKWLIVCKLACCRT